MLGLEKIILPLHLVTATGLFEGLIGVLFKLWHLNMIYFLNAINLAQKCKFVSLICWQKQAEYTVHFTINKKLQQTTKNTFGPGTHFPDDQSIRI